MVPSSTSMKEDRTQSHIEWHQSPLKSCEKLADINKGVLSATIIQPLTSTWDSPPAIVIKKNDRYIRLCVDCGRVDQLTILMLHPMPLTNELFQDMNKGM